MFTISDNVQKWLQDNVPNIGQLECRGSLSTNFLLEALRAFLASGLVKLTSAQPVRGGMMHSKPGKSSECDEAKE